MNRIVALLILLSAVSASADNIIHTYNSKRGQQSIRRYVSVDVANVTNELYVAYSGQFRLRSVPTPALINLNLQIGVTITGTLNQARADLQRLDDERRPARQALKTVLGERNVKQAKQEVKQALRNAFTPAQRKALLDYLELEELITQRRLEAEALGLRDDEE